MTARLKYCTYNSHCKYFQNCSYFYFQTWTVIWQCVYECPQEFH